MPYRLPFVVMMLASMSACTRCNPVPAPSDDAGVMVADGSVAADGGQSLDAGVRDAATTDAAVPDTASFDAATADAAPVSDAGSSGDAASSGDGGYVVRPAHPRIFLVAGEHASLRARLDGNEARATRFKNMVDAQIAGTDHYNFQAWYAALMGQLSGDTAYCAYAIQLVNAWMTSEQALIANGQRAEIAADSYLYVGEHIANVALTYDWCANQLTEPQKTQWRNYADQAVWNVWHPDEAQWGGVLHPWSGWSTDKPSNNYYYSFLRATMLLGLAAYGELARADEWLTKFRVEKMEGQLIPTFAADLVGGGSREGTGYGVSHRSLFELYATWKASTGEDLASRTPHARASIAWFIHATMPRFDRIAPVGDHARDSTAAFFDYHRHYVEVASSLFPGDRLARVAKGYLGSVPLSEMGQPFMYYADFLYDDPSAASEPLSSLYPGYHGAGTGQIFVRSSWNVDATWLGFIAGPYTESHAHHDQGSLLLYRNQWLAYDANISSHSGIRQEEQMHNLVRIDDDGTTVPQRESSAPSVLLALHDEPAYTFIHANSAPVYGSGSIVDVAERKVVFIKPDVVVVFDRVATTGGTNVRKVWQLNTPQPPVVTGTRTTITTDTSDLVVDSVLPATSPTVVNLIGSDPDGDLLDGYRLESAQAGNGTSWFLQVLSVDGAVASAAASGVTGERGVALQMSSGRTAVVRFEEDGSAASMTLSTGSSTLHDGPLPASVATLPLFAQ